MLPTEALRARPNDRVTDMVLAGAHEERDTLSFSNYPDLNPGELLPKAVVHSLETEPS